MKYTHEELTEIIRLATIEIIFTHSDYPKYNVIESIVKKSVKMTKSGKFKKLKTYIIKNMPFLARISTIRTLKYKNGI